jgi:tetratricopeptide (TPR) repeat protein
MKNVLSWMAEAATLSFDVPVSGGQNDPRLVPLFIALKATADADEADQLEASIWALWGLSGDDEIDQIMTIGINAMGDGDGETALTAFNEIISRAPDYAEGWNKRATLFYLAGEQELAISDIKKTLALERRHFGGYSGLGLVYMALGEERKALEAFEKALEIHPHMDGAESHIRELRDIVKGRGI